MAKKYKCSFVGKTKCNRESEGFAKVKGQNFHMCKRCAEREGYNFTAFNDVQLEAMGKRPPAPKQGKPGSIFASDPKKRKK